MDFWSKLNPKTLPEPKPQILNLNKPHRAQFQFFQCFTIRGDEVHTHHLLKASPLPPVDLPQTEAQTEYTAIHV